MMKRNSSSGKMLTKASEIGELTLPGGTILILDTFSEIREVLLHLN